MAIITSCDSYSIIPSKSTNKDNISDSLTGKSKAHESSDDYIFNKDNATQITLNNTFIDANGKGLIVNSNKVTITSSGTYIISGSLKDGQIIVNAKENDIVKIILNGINISNSNTSPFYIIKSKKTIINLADNKENIINDSNSYIFHNKNEDEPNASLFSKSNLTILGNGSLTINGNYNDGISSKEGLIIINGNIRVNSKDDAIRGKDYLIIKGGNFTIKSNGDGFKSDDNDNINKGYISIESGKFNIISDGDSISAKTDLLIKNGEFILSSGNGNNLESKSDISSKALKGLMNTIIEDGKFTINSNDDAIHADNNLVINSGFFNISSNDDAIHSDKKLTINNGVININKSYEGIESKNITINGGNIAIKSENDGISASDKLIIDTKIKLGEVCDCLISINGGYLFIDSETDGIDSNGSIEIKNGTTIIDGPSSILNSSIDYDTDLKITGGFVLGASIIHRNKVIDQKSTQNIVLIKLPRNKSEKTILRVEDSRGNDIFTYSPSKIYRTIFLSSPILKKDENYHLFVGGSSTGDNINGLYKEGNYTPDLKLNSFSINDIFSTVEVK